MRKFKLVLAAATGLAMSSAAYAADAVEAPPEPPVAAPVDIAPAATWSGFYAGAYTGYTWGKFDSTAGNINANGWNLSGFAGGNVQQGSIVYGAEADLGYSWAKANAGGVEVKQGWNGSLRARLGYDLNPVLLYGTAGIAATQATVTDAVGSDRNTHLGWTAGVGADALLTQSVFGRLEYRYTDYGSKAFNTGPGGTAISSGFSDHSVKAGLGVKF